MMDDVSSTKRMAMTPKRRLKVWEEHKGFCCICGKAIDGVREKWIVEHVVPLALGGTDSKENCAPAHETCRRVKDKDDVKRIAKAKRVKAKNIGIKKPSSWPQKPKGFKFSWKTGRMEKEE